MEILLRNYNNEKYVWMEADWRDGKYLVSDAVFGETEIDTLSVMAVRNDNRNNKVQCAYCGAIIENTPEAIERHYVEEEAKKDCTKCRYMRIYGDKMNKQITYEENPDGTYKCSETCEVRLGCTTSYWTKEIHTAEASRNCIYSQCRKKGVTVINDVFVKYPGLFNKQITVDALEAKKYAREEYKNGYFRYDMKLRGALKACVNDIGIVDHFLLIKNGYTTKLYYSGAYNKLFYADWGNYQENVSDIMSESRKSQILDKLSKLYEEVNAND